MFKGARLKSIRERKRVTQDSLADAIGKSKWTIIRMEKDILVPTVDEIGALAARLGVSISELMDSNDFDGIQANRLVKSELLKIPVLSHEWTACCGGGIHALDITSAPEKYISYPRDEFRALDDLRPPFVIYAEGDCLESAGICDRDMVIVNPAEEPPQGAVALVSYNDMLALRRVYRMPSGEIVLVCDTGQTRLSPEKQEEGRLTVVGTVAASIKPRPTVLPLYDL